MSSVKLSYDTNSKGDSVTPCLNRSLTAVGSEGCVRCPHFISIAKSKKNVICGYTFDTPKQIGGTHYEKMKIQPIEFIEANSLGFHVGNAIKYICRYQAKCKTLTKQLIILTD